VRQGRIIDRPIDKYAWRRLAAGWAAGLAAIASSPAQADDAAETQTAPEAAVAPDHLADIIVTARRRPEMLQRTPVSVVAFTRADLESRSVTNLRSLQNFVPNLTFAPSQNVGEAAANVFIRGIGQEDFGVGAEAGVGFYVDGVYFARSLGMLMNLIDIERVEVLRGPQGTLFGKDTIGGAINVISTAPQPRAERNASIILGNIGRIELRSMANAPVSDRLMIRLAAGIVSRDGYLHRLTPPAPLDVLERVNGRAVNLRSEGAEHSQGGRLQLRWLATDGLTADFSLDGTRIRDTQGAIRVDLIDPSSGDLSDINRLIREGKLPGPEISNALVPADFLQSYAGGDNFMYQELWGASAVLSQKLGGNTLKFIGAYRALHSHVGTDDDALYFDIGGSDLEVKQHQMSGELQLTGVAGRLHYTAGLYAFRERPKILPSSAIIDVLYTCGCFYPPDDLPIQTTIPRRLRVENSAAYAQGRYRLTDRLSATLGARYSHERKQVDGKLYQFDPDFPAAKVLLDTGHAKDSWNSFTYRVDAEYQATTDTMFYGSIARGFKSGGFNVRGDLNLPNMGFYSFDPETALTYEIGLRSEWLHRRLRLNATLFDTEYKDIQLRQTAIVNGEVTTLIQNAARARIRGAEVEMMAVPVTGLTLSAAYGHLDPKYLDVGHVRGLTRNSSFQRTPRHSFSGSVDYEAPFRSGRIELHGDFSYRSKEQFQILPAINDQKGYGLFGARLGFRARDDRWSVALFGTNLTDKRYRTAGRGTLIDQVGFAYSSIGMPRQVGVQVGTVF
jgi:iron complex outermembrane receptor protein